MPAQLCSFDFSSLPPSISINLSAPPSLQFKSFALSSNAATMSNASSQAYRAGVRESSGNGSSNARRVENPIPPLQPNDESIRILLEGRKIANMDEKYNAIKAVYANRGALIVYLEGIREGSSSDFAQINWGNPTKLLSKASFQSKPLAKLFCDVRHSLVSILPTTVNYNGLTRALQKAIDGIHVHYDNAQRTAAVELQAEFSSQFLNIRGAEADRKYLVDGYRPTIPGLSNCISCGHGFCDEPNTNREKTIANQQKKLQYDAQAAADTARWNNGEQVMSNRNEVMQPYRKRPQPTYEQLIVHCHCDEFACTSGDGEVPTNLCPIKCIDPDTTKRYTIDINGQCLCPICSCNSCPKFFTVRFV
jgi:hypothetical protein